MSEEQGAQTQIWLATDPQVKANGEFFTRKKPDFTSPQSKRQGLIDSLWEYSMEELKIEQFGELGWAARRVVEFAKRYVTNMKKQKTRQIGGFF